MVGEGGSHRLPYGSPAIRTHTLRSMTIKKSSVKTADSLTDIELGTVRELVEVPTTIQSVPGGMCQTSGECSLS